MEPRQRGSPLAEPDIVWHVGRPFRRADPQLASRLACFGSLEGPQSSTSSPRTTPERRASGMADDHPHDSDPGRPTHQRRPSLAQSDVSEADNFFETPSGGEDTVLRKEDGSPVSPDPAADPSKLRADSAGDPTATAAAPSVVDDNATLADLAASSGLGPAEQDPSTFVLPAAVPEPCGIHFACDRLELTQPRPQTRTTRRHLCSSPPCGARSRTSPARSPRSTRSSSRRIPASATSMTTCMIARTRSATSSFVSPSSSAARSLGSGRLRSAAGSSGFVAVKLERGRS